MADKQQPEKNAKPSRASKGKRKATSPEPTPTPDAKRRSRKQDKTADGKAPPPVGKTEAEIHNMKVFAKTHNMKGVRVSNKNLESGGPVLCGYLNLQDTNALRSLLFDSDVAGGILKRWRQHRMSGFGILDKTGETTWQKAQIWQYITKPGSLTMEQLQYDIPLPSNTDKDFHGVAKGYVSWVVTMWRLMQEIPECFEGAAIGTDQALGGRGFEDWNRAYEICRAYYRAHSESRLGEAVERKPQNKPAQQPLFLTDVDLANTATNEQTKLSADNLTNLLAQFDRDEELDQAGEEADRVEPGELLEMSEQLNEQFETSFHNIKTSLSKIDPLSVLPRLTAPDQSKLAAWLGQKASVLYPQGDALMLDNLDVVDSSVREQTQASMLEEVLGNPDEVSSTERSRFWSLMTDLNQVTAPAPTYEEACRILKLDPANPRVDTGLEEPRKPYPWQIVAVAWLIGMEESVLGGALLADDMGLGKTLVALLVVILSVNLRAAQAEHSGDTAATYRPTLIACPSSAYGTWKSEIQKHCPTLPRRYYMGSPNQGSVVDRANVLGTSPKALKAFVATLDPHDPNTAKTVILTTYTTWLARTVHGDTSVPKPRSRNNRDVPTDDDSDADDDGDNKEKEESVEELNKLQTECEGLFDRVICDEAHKLKSDRTRTSRSIGLLKAPKLIFLTATPMINKPMDLTGVLALLWKDTFEKKDMPPVDIADFEEAKMSMQSSKLTAVNFSNYVRLLDPKVFRRFAQPSGGGQMRAADSNVILPPILTLIQLRRTMSDEIEVLGTMQKVAAEVPPYRIVTVELKMDETQAGLYQSVHRRLAGSIASGADAETGEGRMDQRVHRLLCHATFNPLLHKIAERAKIAVKNVNHWSETYSDYGVSWYHRMTRSDRISPAYRNRVNMAIYMSGSSVKLQWLSGMLHNICTAAKSRVIVFHDWPMPLWNTTAYILTLGYEVIDIRSAHGFAERDYAARRFNDPNDPVQVLVTSVRTMSASVNLQQACHHMIFLDVPGSANTTLQAIGRIFRLGQTHPQKVWIATVDHTYDQVIQARAAKKMVSQIAGQGNINVTDEDIAAAQAQGDGLDDTAAKSAAIESKASDLYTKMFGQFDSRLEWGDIRNLHAKDAFRGVGIPSITSDRARTRSTAKQATLRKDGKITARTRSKVQQSNVDAGEGSSTGRVRERKAADTEAGGDVGKQGSHGEESRLKGDDVDEQLQIALNQDILEQNRTANTTHGSSEQHPNSTAPVIEPAKDSSSKTLDLPWSTYLQSNDPSHDPNNPQLEDADGENSYPNYFEALDIDDNTTLEEIHKAYNVAREEQKSSDTFEEQLAELDVALKVTTSPHLRQQWLETYEKKIRAHLRRKPEDTLQFSIPVEVEKASSPSPIGSPSNPINEEPTSTLTSTTAAAKPHGDLSDSGSSMSSLDEVDKMQMARDKTRRPGKVASDRPKRGAAVKSSEITRKQLGGKDK